MAYSLKKRDALAARVRPEAELLSISAAAVELGCHPRTIVRWAEDPSVGLRLTKIRGRNYIPRPHWEQVKAGLTGQGAVAIAAE
jgi:hypothetical protein